MEACWQCSAGADAVVEQFEVARGHAVQDQGPQVVVEACWQCPVGANEMVEQFEGEEQLAEVC